MPTKYRYHGTKSEAIHHGGIVTCAVRKTGNKNEDGQEEYLMGLSITPDGFKFDAISARAVADYRLNMLAAKLRSATDLDYEEALDSTLEARRGHFCKTTKVGFGVYARHIKKYVPFTSADFVYSPNYCLAMYIKDAKAEDIDRLVLEFIIARGFVAAPINLRKTM